MADNKFDGKNVVITGAASGMGKAIAEHLANLKANVVVSDIDRTRGIETVKYIVDQGGSAEYRYLDVTDQEAFIELLHDVVNKYGSLDYLFNNAGIAIFGEVRDQSLEDWKKVIEIDQMGVLYGTLAAYEIMRKQGFGHIVNTASVAGLTPTPLLVPYSMAKHAVVGLTVSLREEAKAFGVKVSAVCPGVIRTNIASNDFTRGSEFPDPFGFLEEKLKLKTISANEAAAHIIKGVNKNQAKIIFPKHGNAIVKGYQYFSAVSSQMNQLFLKVYRKDYRHQ